jgi:hypothetical protein
VLDTVAVKLQGLASGALLRVARQADDRITVARTPLAQDRLYTTSRLALRQLATRADLGVLSPFAPSA